MTRLAARLYASRPAQDLRVACHAAARQDRRDRGDVPGWVLITVMTAGLVTALWLVAGPALTDLFRSAISSVSGK